MSLDHWPIPELLEIRQNLVKLLAHILVPNSVNVHHHPIIDKLCSNHLNTGLPGPLDLPHVLLDSQESLVEVFEGGQHVGLAVIQWVSPVESYILDYNI